MAAWLNKHCKFSKDETESNTETKFSDSSSALDSDDSFDELFKERKKVSTFGKAGLDPKQVLQKAFNSIRYFGSATATLCSLSHSQLNIANLGDSGFMVIRFEEGVPRIFARSDEQTHAFNVPYQLTKVPDKVFLDKLKSFNLEKEFWNLKLALEYKKFCKDDPKSSDSY